MATLQVKAKNRKPVIGTMYFAIREEAKKLGANCFIINYYVWDTLNNVSILVLDSYYASDSILTINAIGHETNAVYIFGKEGMDEKTISFTVKGEKMEIKSGTFLKYALTEKDDFYISKGGFAGESIRIMWGSNMPPAFYTLSGFGVDEMMLFNDRIAFHSGKINQLSNISLGLLLTHLLKQGN
ncbi:MAG: hypothetical protein ABI772_06010 [Bacteroidota bacterium]